MGGILVVVNGAKMNCSEGVGDSFLWVTTPSKTDVENKAPATDEDYKSGDNIPPFQHCRKIGGPCIPVTVSPWEIPFFSGVLTSPFKADMLPENAQLHCALGGDITIVDPNQSTMLINEAVQSEAAVRAAEMELAELEAEIKDVLKELGFDAAATLDPTGVVDAGLAIRSLIKGKFGDAALSAISALPFGDLVGKTAKAAKGAKKLASLQKALDAARRNLGALRRTPNYTADLRFTKARSRSGHSNAGNKQLHEAMKNDPKLRRRMEAKYGDDVFDRTSTSNGGRRNPRGAEWDHNSNDPNSLDLLSRKKHLKKTRREGQAGGGWKRFHKDREK